jgi:hypothetical protein
LEARKAVVSSPLFAAMRTMKSVCQVLVLAGQQARHKQMQGLEETLKWMSG